MSSALRANAEVKLASSERQHDSWLTASLLVATFLGSFLLFQIQPLIGRAILPWFGGSASVWTICLLFFQFVLLAGYVYADCTSRWLHPRAQITVHLSVLALCVASLPILPDDSLKPTDGNAPVGQIIKILAVSIGLVFLAVSANSSLLARWWDQSGRPAPYSLYAVSNIGSLVGLLSFPFLFEPYLSTHVQASIWGTLFVLLCCLLLTCMVGLWRLPARPHQDSRRATNSQRMTAGRRMAWLLLAATGAVQLMSVTSFLCQDVSSGPFVWTLPLATYLLSFVLCFARRSWYRRAVFIPLVLVGTIVCAYLHRHSAQASFVELLAAFVATLFCTCMVCHGELERTKPSSEWLTHFYTLISAGGFLGGTAVALIAPQFFVDYYELPIGFLATNAIVLAALWFSEASRQRPRMRASLLLVTVLATGLQLSHWTASFGQRAGGDVLTIERNFYGVLKSVKEANPSSGVYDYVSLVHGDTVHGGQYVTPENQSLATAYFSKNTAIGFLLTQLASDRPSLRVGVVGLGVGTLAAYARAEDTYRFYELDPAVVRIAEDLFTYLSDAQERGATVEIIPGDARLALERAEASRFDVLVIDAFSGDAIPVHLLTKEAVGEYMRHLQPEGILAIHVTNRYLDLARVTSGLANFYNLAHTVYETTANPSELQPGAKWILLQRRSTQTDRVMLQLDLPATPPVDLEHAVLWSDDRYSLLDVLSH